MLLAFKQQPRLPQYQQEAPPPPPPAQPARGVPHAMAAGHGMGAPPPGAFYAEQQAPLPPAQAAVYGGFGQQAPGYGASAAGTGFGGTRAGPEDGSRPWQGGAPPMGGPGGVQGPPSRGPGMGGPGTGIVPAQQAMMAAQQIAASFAAQHQAQQQQQQGWQQQGRYPPGPGYDGR